MMADVDARIHLALATCAAAFDCGPKLPAPARALIVGAMQLLLEANRHIKRKVKVK